MKRIIILGGYGDGVVISSALQDLSSSIQSIVPYGFLNDFKQKGTTIGGLPVLDRIENAINYLDQNNIYFISALLKVKKSFERSEKIKNLNIPPSRFFTLIHPKAVVSQTAKIGNGTFIGPHVTVMPGAVIGNHCSFRASASVGHDCVIGDYCYLGPNSTLSGRVILEDGAHIGPNASVLEKVTIGKHSVVGLGSAVIKDVPSFSVAFGCPARIIEKLDIKSQNWQ